MAIRVECSGCKKKLTAKAEQAGKRVRCPACGKIIEISPSQAKVAAPPPDPKSYPSETLKKPSPPLKPPVERRSGPPVKPAEAWYVQCGNAETELKLIGAEVVQGLREGWLSLDDLVRESENDSWTPIRGRLAKEIHQIDCFIDTPKAYGVLFAGLGMFAMAPLAFSIALVAGLAYVNADRIWVGVLLLVVVVAELVVFKRFTPLSLIMGLGGLVYLVMGLGWAAFLVPGAALLGGLVGLGGGFCIGRLIGSRVKDRYTLPSERMPVPEPILTEKGCTLFYSLFDKENQRPIEQSVLILLRYCVPQRGLFVIPHIPAKKLSNAMKSCRIPNANTILGLLDCTSFGSATNGLVFCHEGVVFHNSTKQGREAIQYADFKHKTFAAGEGIGQVSLGSGQSLEAAACGVPQENIGYILNSIKEIVSNARLPGAK